MRWHRSGNGTGAPTHPRQAVSPVVVQRTIYEGFIPQGQAQTSLQGFNVFHPTGRVGTSEDSLK